MKKHEKTHNEIMALRVSARLAHGWRTIACANSKPYSCKIEKVSLGAESSAQLAHELAHNDFNGLRVSARLKSVSAHLSHGKMSCDNGSRSSPCAKCALGGYVSTTPRRTSAGAPTSMPGELSCPVKRKIELARNSNLTAWPIAWQVAVIQIGCSNQTGGSNAFPRNLYDGQLPRAAVLLRRHQTPCSKGRRRNEPSGIAITLRCLRRRVRVHGSRNVFALFAEPSMQSASAAWRQGLNKARFFGTAQKGFLNRGHAHG